MREKKWLLLTLFLCTLAGHLFATVSYGNEEIVLGVATSFELGPVRS